MEMNISIKYNNRATLYITFGVSDKVNRFGFVFQDYQRMAKHIHVHESISGKNVVTTRRWITHSHR